MMFVTPNFFEESAIFYSRSNPICLTEQTNHSRVRLYNGANDFVTVGWFQKLQLREIDTAKRMVVRRDPQIGRYQACKSCGRNERRDNLCENHGEATMESTRHVPQMFQKAMVLTLGKRLLATYRCEVTATCSLQKLGSDRYTLY